MPLKTVLHIWHPYPLQVTSQVSCGKVLERVPLDSKNYFFYNLKPYVSLSLPKTWFLHYMCFLLIYSLGSLDCAIAPILSQENMIGTYYNFITSRSNKNIFKPYRFLCYFTSNNLCFYGWVSNTILLNVLPTYDSTT